MKRRQFLRHGLTSPLWRPLGAGAALLAPTLAQAQFKIDVAGIGATQIPVGIGDFVGQKGCPQQIADIVRADLVRSGQFRVSIPGGAPFTEQGPAAYAAWHAAGLDAAAGGSVAQTPDGHWIVRFRMWDAVKQADLGGQAYTVVAGDLRLVAHRIADFIYQKLTGQRGVFATRIAYIDKGGRNAFGLVVADSDGENARAALRSREPLMSPTWSPDGGSVAYVSFETGKPVVFVQDIRRGVRRAVADFRGSNSAPAFSPDGRTLAVVLTLGGESQVYLLPSEGGRPHRLTDSGSIATEPVFSPDGQSLYFVSDRDGSPQIYRIGRNGGQLQRITFSGDYNVSPAISPDGTTLAYASRRRGDFQIWVQNLASGQTTALGDGPNDGRPTFAPNGQIILYSATEGGAEVLKTVSIDGAVRTTLATHGQQVREPSWGPWTAMI